MSSWHTVHFCSREELQDDDVGHPRLLRNELNGDISLSCRFSLKNPIYRVVHMVRYSNIWCSTILLPCSYRVIHQVWTWVGLTLVLGVPPAGWVAAVATYCPSRMVEYPKSKSTQPNVRTWWITLYISANLTTAKQILLEKLTSCSTQPNSVTRWIPPCI